jgi:hypothetical protein
MGMTLCIGLTELGLAAVFPGATTGFSHDGVCKNSYEFGDEKYVIPNTCLNLHRRWHCGGIHLSEVLLVTVGFSWGICVTIVAARSIGDVVFLVREGGDSRAARVKGRR